MRPTLLAVCLALCARAQAASLSGDSGWAAPANQSLSLHFARPYDESAALREAFRTAARSNPVAAEFAVPLLDSVAFQLKTEAQEPKLHGVIANYTRDASIMTLNRDAIAEAIPGFPASGAPAPAQLLALADRFLPVIVHEIGGHARHYRDLAHLLGHPGPNVIETEVYALWLEAMTTASRRKTDPSYLRGSTSYEQGESRLVDNYWEAKHKNDPAVFRAYVAATPGYSQLPAATGDVAAYYQAEQKRLWNADSRLIGPDLPDDEREAVDPDPFEKLPRGGMR